MSLVATCTDPTIVAGQALTACPAASLVFKEETTFWDPALSTSDVAELLSATLFTLILAWGFRQLYLFILNRR